MKKILVLALSGIAIIPTTLTSTGCNSKIELGSSVGKGITYGDLVSDKISIQYAEVGLLNGKVSTVEINETIGGYNTTADDPKNVNKVLEGKTYEQAKLLLNDAYSYYLREAQTSAHEINYTFLCYIKVPLTNGSTIYTGYPLVKESQDWKTEEKCKEEYSSIATWVGGGNKVLAQKTSDIFRGVNTKGDPIGVIDREFNNGVMSIRESYNKAYGFHDKNNGYDDVEKDWMDNVTLIEEFFKGKTWNDIESMNEFTGENKTDKKTQIPGVIYDVDGAKNDEIITTYALRVKDAVKKALGK